MKVSFSKAQGTLTQTHAQRHTGIMGQAWQRELATATAGELWLISVICQECCKRHPQFAAAAESERETDTARQQDSRTGGQEDSRLDRRCAPQTCVRLFATCLMSCSGNSNINNNNNNYNALSLSCIIIIAEGVGEGEGEAKAEGDVAQAGCCCCCCCGCSLCRCCCI